MTDTDRDAVERLAYILEKSLGREAAAAPTLRALLAAKEGAEAEAAALRERLLPFVDAARDRAADAPEWGDNDTVSIWVTIGELRQTLATIDQPKEGGDDDG